MQKLIWTNSNGESINLTDGNYGITNWEGFSNTPLNIQSQQVPFQDGGIFLDALVEQRELSVTLAMQDNGNLEDRYRMRRELIHALNPKLGEGYLIYKNDFTEKRIKCIAQIPLFETHNSNDSGTPKATLVWTACEPYWEDVDETIISLKKGVTTIQNSGDIPTSVLIDLFTSSANNVVISNFNNSKSLKLIQKIESSIRINTASGSKTVTGIDITWDGFPKKYLYGACFAKKLNLMVIVGDQVILTSSDGVNWKYIETSYFLYQVIYSENLGLFIATGLRNKVLTSSDGVNWNEQYIYEDGTIISSYLDKICYSEELSLFVARSLDNPNTFLYKSSDGINWVKVFTSNNDLNTIYYSEDLNLFIVGGDQVILTSSDGVNWNETSITYNLSAIIYVSSKNAFYASGYQGIFKSSDGVNWDKLYDFSTFLTEIIYSKELDLFVVIGPAGTILTSINGVDWVDRTLVQQQSTLNYIIFNPNINSFVIDGDNCIVYTSSDGVNWESQISDITDTLTAICYSQKNKKYIMVGMFYYEYNAIYTSSNGHDWNRIVVQPLFQAICCSEKLGIIVAVGYIKIGISSDGENWNYVDFVNPRTLRGITYSEDLNLFVAVGGIIITSPNGYDWTLENITLNNDESLLSVCYSEELNLFVAVGKRGTSDGILYTSSNGHDWNLILTSDENLNDVTYSEELNLFVAVGDFKILTSSDGINWNETTIDTYLNGITFSKELNLFVAVGYQWIYTSSDGVNWDKIQITRYLEKVCYSNVLNQFVAIGLQGNMVTSNMQETKNLIHILSTDSDMTFDLDIGENRILLSAEGSVTGRLTYRKKYMGV